MKKLLIIILVCCLLFLTACQNPNVVQSGTASATSPYTDPHSSIDFCLSYSMLQEYMGSSECDPALANVCRAIDPWLVGLGNNMVFEGSKDVMHATLDTSSGWQITIHSKKIVDGKSIEEYTRSHTEMPEEFISEDLSWIPLREIYAEIGTDVDYGSAHRVIGGAFYVWDGGKLDLITLETNEYFISLQMYDAADYSALAPYLQLSTAPAAMEEIISALDGYIAP